MSEIDDYMAHAYQAYGAICGVLARSGTQVASSSAEPLILELHRLLRRERDFERGRCKELMASDPYWPANIYETQPEILRTLEIVQSEQPPTTPGA